MVAGVRNFKRKFADMPNTSYMHNAAVLYPTHMRTFVTFFDFKVGGFMSLCH